MTIHTVLGTGIKVKRGTGIVFVKRLVSGHNRWHACFTESGSKIGTTVLVRHVRKITNTRKEG